MEYVVLPIYYQNNKLKNATEDTKTRHRASSKCRRGNIARTSQLQ